MRKHSLFFTLLILLFLSSCKRFVSVYQLRHSVLDANDSLIYFDSVFCDELYVIDTLLKGKAQHGSFNGNVLVAYKGVVIYKNSIGLKNIFFTDSLSLLNQFQLASVSKPFTSTAILQLCERGKLSLDDTLEKFFPELPYHGITVRMLLCHRSGLPDYVKFTEKYYKTEKPVSLTNDSLIRLMCHLKPRMLSKPNEKHDYSNTGFMLLASIVEKVSGKDFRTYVRDYIFNPCKMKNTFYYHPDTLKIKDLAVVAFDEGELVENHYHNGVIGDKGIYSTVSDLLLFDQALRKGKLLSRQWQDSAYTRQNPDWEGAYNYGYGWRLRTGYNNEKIVYHSGWWKGFRSLFVRDLSRDLTFIIMDNVRDKKFMFVEDYLWIFDKEKETIFF